MKYYVSTHNDKNREITSSEIDFPTEQYARKVGELFYNIVKNHKGVSSVKVRPQILDIRDTMYSTFRWSAAGFEQLSNCD